MLKKMVFMSDYSQILNYDCNSYSNNIQTINRWDFVICENVIKQKKIFVILRKWTYEKVILLKVTKKMTHHKISGNKKLLVDNQSLK